MSDSHSVRTPVRACPHCTTLDIAHVGDTEKSRWLECRECGHVWNHSLPPAAPSVREPAPLPAEPKRWTMHDEAERRVDAYRARPGDAAWTRDPGWPKDRWPLAEREWNEDRGLGRREESPKLEDGTKAGSSKYEV
jgi:hypothetical protein